MRIGPKQRRLAIEADLRGNADGRATKNELRKMRPEVKAPTTPGLDDPLHPAVDRARELEKTIGADDEIGIATFDPALAKLPENVRRLALEIDGLWGNADGKVSVDELDRVAKYYLAALPYFTKEASALLELAEFLGFDKAAPAAAPGVIALRAGLAHVDKQEVKDGARFRELFDVAMRDSSVAGAPELVRDAAQHNPKWHTLSILEHTAVAVDAAREIGQMMGTDWRPLGATMLLHDVGKVLQRGFVDKEGDGGRYHFWEHEGIGAGWLQAHRMPPKVLFHVRYHSVLRENTVQEMVSLCGSKERLAEALVVYVADQVAKGVEPAQLESFEQEREKITELCGRAGIDAETLFTARALLIEKHFGKTGA